MNNKARGFFGERPLPKFEVDSQVLRRRTRRDVLLFGAREDYWAKRGYSHNDGI
jgi:hypothetical protein